MTTKLRFERYLILKVFSSRIGLKLIRHVSRVTHALFRSIDPVRSAGGLESQKGFDDSLLSLSLLTWTYDLLLG
jgi:hypothetical protein